MADVPLRNTERQMAALPSPSGRRPNEIVTVASRGKVRIECYWPDRNHEPMIAVRVTGGSDWIRPDDWRWVTDQIAMLRLDWEARRG